MDAIAAGNEEAAIVLKGVVIIELTKGEAIMVSTGDDSIWN